MTHIICFMIAIWVLIIWYVFYQMVHPIWMLWLTYVFLLLPDLFVSYSWTSSQLVWVREMWLELIPAFLPDSGMNSSNMPLLIPNAFAPWSNVTFVRRPKLFPGTGTFFSHDIYQLNDYLWGFSKLRHTWSERSSSWHFSFTIMCFQPECLEFCMMKNCKSLWLDDHI